MTTALEPIAIDPPADTAVVSSRSHPLPPRVPPPLPAPACVSSRSHRLLPRFALAFLLGLAAVLALGAGALYAYDQQYAGRVLPGVHIGDVDLSGLDAGAAAGRLHARYDTLGQGTITVVAGQYRVSAPFASA